MHLEDRGAGCERLRSARCPDHFVLLSGLRVLCFSLSCPPVGVRADVPMPTSPFLTGPPHRLRRGRLPNIGVHWPLHNLEGPFSRLTAGMGWGRREHGTRVGSQYGVSASCRSLAESGILLCNLKFRAFSIGVQPMLMECSRLQSAVQTDAGLTLAFWVFSCPQTCLCV